MTADLLPPAWTPHADPGVLAAVTRALESAGLTVRRDHLLARATTLGVGGCAAAYVTCDDLPAVRALAVAIGGTEAAELPVFVLGKGSNTLIGDGGVDTLVVRLGAGLKWARREGLVVEAGAGEAMPALAAWVAREGLTGLEFAAGIPATVGGSVRMNAGAHGGDVASRLVSVEAVVPGGDVVSYRPAELGFSYRHSVLPSRSVVTAARWELAPDDPVEIRRRLDDLRAWRRRTQPLRERSCGSVFANPPGDSAGRLIEAAGCKDQRVGGARVSAKHANFIVVEAGTTAADVRTLVGAVRSRVRDDAGVVLEPEVRLVGTFA